MLVWICEYSCSHARMEICRRIWRFNHSCPSGLPRSSRCRIDTRTVHGCSNRLSITSKNIGSGTTKYSFRNALVSDTSFATFVFIFLKNWFVANMRLTPASMLAPVSSGRRTRSKTIPYRPLHRVAFPIAGVAGLLSREPSKSAMILTRVPFFKCTVSIGSNQNCRW